MKLEKNYVKGKVTYDGAASEVAHQSSGQPSHIRKRFNGFTAVAPGWGGYGPRMTSLGDYYDKILTGQLVLTPDNKYAFVDPLMSNPTLKKDSPLTNADTGAYNTIFGAQAIIQYVQHNQALSALPKSVWPQSGFRVVTTAPWSSGLGHAQSGDRSATEEPTYLEVSVTPKEISKSFELSLILDMQSNTDDTVTYTVNRDVCESAFLNAWDADILVDGATAAGNNFDSLDRYTASYSVANTFTWNGTYEDYWHSPQRSAASYWDAQAYHNSGTDRYLTRSHLDTMIYACSSYWTSNVERGNKFLLTGPTTMPSFESLEEAKQFITTTSVTMGINGVSTNTGQDGGYVATAYKKFPIIFDYNVAADTLERIYLIDTDYCGIVMGRPLELIEESNPIIVGTNRLGMFLGIGETWGTKPASSGSIRDLK